MMKHMVGDDFGFVTQRFHATGLMYQTTPPQTLALSSLQILKKSLKETLYCIITCSNWLVRQQLRLQAPGSSSILGYFCHCLKDQNK